jgi:hypothetical protein
MYIQSNTCQPLIEKALEEFSSKNFSFFGENRPTDEDLKRNPINIYWHCEPEEYFMNHSWIAQNYYKFNHVLTWNQKLLETLPNAVKTLFGTSCFHEKITDITHEGNYNKKHERLTFIRGDKKFPVPGHQLRWELYDNVQKLSRNVELEFYSRTDPAYASTPEEEVTWYAQRRHIFESPMFHIAIENTSHPNYFTEKIIDCLLFKTVPIYWGCPNIGEYFDERGIIRVNSLNDIIRVSEELSRGLYEEMIFTIRENQFLAHNHMSLGKTLRDTVAKLLL